MVLGCTWCGPSRGSRACRPHVAGGAGGVEATVLDINRHECNPQHGKPLSTVAVAGGTPCTPVIGRWDPAATADYDDGHADYGFSGGRVVESALLAFERMVIVERVQSRVRRI